MLDGFKWDYYSNQKEELPGFTKFLQGGVQAEYVEPVFPSLSYACWTTIGTGVYPEVHGILGNYMYDRQNDIVFSIDDLASTQREEWWQNSEPIWITATKNNKKAFLRDWSRCDVPFNGTMPAVCSGYTGAPGVGAINDLMTLFKLRLRVYGEHIDNIGHEFGPDSPELKQMVREVDQVLADILQDMENSGLDETVNTIIVGDHGMKFLGEGSGLPEAVTFLNLSDYISATDIFKVVDRGPHLTIATLRNTAKQVYESLQGNEGFDVYCRDEISDDFHYKHGSLVQDILVVAHPNYYIRGFQSPNQIPVDDPNAIHSGGTHGYINNMTDMRTIFFARGPGNLMVILVVTLHWRMRSITNFCLANLAFADLCVGVFCVYQNIVTYLMDSWIFGEFMCKMYHFINSLSTTASVLILVVICIERYLAIIHPMTCKQMMTLNRLRITIICVWILSAAISSPRFYYFSTVTIPLSNGEHEILCLPNRTKYDSKLLDMISMTVLFIIPLGIITILYTHIGIVLWRTSTTKMPAGSTSIESSSSCSGSYYREAESNVMQTINLTLLPVNNVQQASRPTTLHPLFPSASPATSKPNHITGTQCQLSGRKSFLLSSPLVARLNCGKKQRKLQSRSTKRKSREKNGHLKFRLDANGSLGQDYCLPCKTLAQQETINHQLVASHNCQCNTAEASFSNNCCAQNHNPVDDNGVEHHDDFIGSSEVELRKNEDATTSPLTTCCASGRSKCLSRLRKPGRKTKKAVTFSTPPSPFCNGQYANDFNGKNTKTDPIVLVKFEKKQSRNKKGQISHCTIIMNTKNVETSSRQFAEKTFKSKNGECKDDCGSQCNESASGESSQAIESYSFSTFRYKPKPPPANNNLLSSRPPKRLKRLRVLKSSKYGTGALQSRRRIVKMLIVVVLAFAVCHMPFHARKVWQYMSSTYQGGSVFSQVFTPLTFLVMYLNSAINPILYAFMSKKFRMSFRDLLCCKTRQSLKMSRNVSVRSTHVVAMSHAIC
ncbi:unnamed protein product [Orchesella dallaii]|uniref:G-protein coupled receptors family 1 profile domain-containing protein n=1 Tax=Orchesella dallaii TaxID=48710 RepID=A0ABP1PLI9_9HEXA